MSEVIAQVLIDKLVIFLCDVFEGLQNDCDEQTKENHAYDQIIREEIHYSEALHSTSNRFI